MADPTFQTFCCRKSNLSTNILNIIDEFDSDSYNVCCIISSLIGIIGALFMIHPKGPSELEFSWSSMNPSRGKQIVIWLAVADLLACLGVFIRSIIWLNRERIHLYDNEEEDIIICASTFAWVQYFYMSTWLWTICYAIDMKLILSNKNGFPKIYHFLCWVIPAILCLIALLILYLPNANCHQVNNLPEALFRILPNYCTTYGPLILALILCPSLYFYSWNQIRLIIIRGLNQLTSRERSVLRIFKMKFALITLSLYFCWWPNLVTSIILWFFWDNLPTKVIVSFWYIMALTNPLQAFLNAIFYKNWTCINSLYLAPILKSFQRIPIETTPLLESNNTKNSINNSSQF